MNGWYNIRFCKIVFIRNCGYIILELVLIINGGNFYLDFVRVVINRYYFYY